MSSEKNSTPSSKRRRYDAENRIFKPEWEEQFLFVEQNDKPMCLMCDKVLSNFKAYNLKRHYETHHLSFDEEFPPSSLSRRIKVLSLKQKFANEGRPSSTSPQSSPQEYDVTAEAGLVNAASLARGHRPASDGEFLKKNITQIVSILDPHNAKLLKKLEELPASKQSIERKMAVMNAKADHRSHADLATCTALSLALEISTEIRDKPQLIVFVRYVSGEFQVKEEFLDLMALTDADSADIKAALDAALEKSSVSKSKLVSLATDDSLTMKDPRAGVVGLLTADPAYPEFLHVRSVLPRDYFISKYFQFEAVLTTIHRLLQSSQAHANKEGHVRKLLADLDHGDLLAQVVTWPVLVKWQLEKNVASRFFDVLELAQEAFKEDKALLELHDPTWLCDLAFFVDVLHHLDTFHASAEGVGKLISDLGRNVLSFGNKLRLFQKDLGCQRLNHFKSLKALAAKGIVVRTDDYEARVLSLALDVGDRFSSLRALKTAFGFLEDPFAVDVVEHGCPVPPPVALDVAAVELELLEVHEDESLQRLRNGCTGVVEFWKQVPEDKYPRTKECAQRLVAISGTTSFCEPLYSAAHLVKLEYRPVLSEDHLKELVDNALASHL